MDVENPPGTLEALATQVQAELGLRGDTIASAESLTGGELAGWLSAAPGASDFYLGGVVSYATSLKTDLLGVRSETLAEHGVVSAACAEEMAAGARRITGATYAVSTTGVAGPTEQEGQPVGRVYVGLAGPEGVTAIRLDLEGDRAEIRRQACRRALEATLERIVGPLG